MPGLGARGNQLDREFLAGEPARATANGHPAPGGVLERGPAAPRELGDDQHLLVLLTRDLTPRRPQHPDKLIIREIVKAEDCFLGQAGQQRPGWQHVRLTALPEVRSPQRGTPGLLIAGLGLDGTDGTACRALTVQPRHILSPLLVEVNEVSGSNIGAIDRERVGTELLVFVHVPPPPEYQVQKSQYRTSYRSTPTFHEPPRRCVGAISRSLFTP